MFVRFTQDACSPYGQGGHGGLGRLGRQGGHSGHVGHGGHGRSKQNLTEILLVHPSQCHTFVCTNMMY